MRFFVAGIPAPKGSLKAFYVKKLGRAMIVNDNAKTKPWADSIRGEAMAAGLKPVSDPVCVRLKFFMPRPKGDLAAKGGVRPSAPTHHTKKPDTDKLARTCLDALTAIAYNDDAQVIELVAQKVYCEPGRIPGVEVDIKTMARRPLAGPTNDANGKDGPDGLPWKSPARNDPGAFSPGSRARSMGAGHGPCSVRGAPEWCWCTVHGVLHRAPATTHHAPCTGTVAGAELDRAGD